MNLKFVLREALTGLRRNITITIAMIITTAISLALLATGILLTSMTERTKDIYFDRVEVMVQLDDAVAGPDLDCTGPVCAHLKSELEADDGVSAVTYRNKQESYDRFVEMFGESDPQLVEQTSPDALPAALHVRMDDPRDTSPIDAIAGQPGIIDIVDQRQQVEDAADNLDSIRNAAFLIAAVQAVAAVFLIANMVQIAAYSRREEISIMRMVGATRWYTQMPFIVEAVLGALIGSLLGIGGMVLVNRLVVAPAMSSLYDSNLIARVTDSDIWAVAPFMIGMGIIVAAITAQVTLRWYVKK